VSAALSLLSLVLVLVSVLVLVLYHLDSILPDRLTALESDGIRRLPTLTADDDDNGTDCVCISFDDDDNDVGTYSLIGCNNDVDDPAGSIDVKELVLIIPCNWSDETVAIFTGWGKCMPLLVLVLVLVWWFVLVW